MFIDRTVRRLSAHQYTFSYIDLCRDTPTNRGTSTLVKLSLSSPSYLTVYERLDCPRLSGIRDQILTQLASAAMIQISSFSQYSIRLPIHILTCLFLHFPFNRISVSIFLLMFSLAIFRYIHIVSGISCHVITNYCKEHIIF